MKKYFLLSAVALMISGTANATTDYAEVTAKATIEVAGTFECTDVDFGTIVVKQNNEELIVYNSYTYGTGTASSESSDVISVSKDGGWGCTGPTVDGEEIVIDGSIQDITLRSGNNDTPLSLRVGVEGGDGFAELTIPANVKAGTYTGSFTVTQTY